MVYIGAAYDEHLRQLAVAVLRSQQQQGVASFVLGVDFEACVQRRRRKVAINSRVSKY